MAYSSSLASIFLSLLEMSGEGNGKDIPEIINALCGDDSNKRFSGDSVSCLDKRFSCTMKGSIIKCHESDPFSPCFIKVHRPGKGSTYRREHQCGL